MAFMLTPKQNLLETLKKDGKPECLCNSFTMFRGIPGDPCFKLIRGNRIRGTKSYDQWGTLILFPEDAPAAIPYVTEENQVIKDVAEWQKYVKVPDLAGKCSEGWEEALEAKSRIDQEKYLTMVVMGTGIFEQLHMLMTFEDTLMNFLLEPEAMHELIDVICEYRLTYMKLWRICIRTVLFPMMTGEQKTACLCRRRYGESSLRSRTEDFMIIFIHRE